eukprot:TRINITY_DN81448_c0_g1_i1.p1 TRINITY_DN81448_c0_g1~~TRINITY_DN81448_c0_g1_i1.p1  ORF type:complete len:329 (+),score=80.40 TRINITY_DN81448_c0_g1_i1:72-1058(+)
MVRRGAFSTAVNADDAEDRTDREELLALRFGGYAAKPREDENEEQPEEILKPLEKMKAMGLDESGFLDDVNDPLQFVTDENRRDGVEYEVVYKRVAIRKSPSIDARVFGACEKGERLKLFESDDESGLWRKLHFRLLGGHGPLVEAWILTKHHQLGLLLRRTDGIADDASPGRGAATRHFRPQAGAAAEAAAGQPPDLSSEEDQTAAAAAIVANAGQRLSLAREVQLPSGIVHGGLETFEVVRKPFVAVRSRPRTDATIIFTAETGQIVETFGEDETGLWRKVFCVVDIAGKAIDEETLAMLPTAPLVAWVLTTHENLGMLLKPVRMD